MDANNQFFKESRRRFHLSRYEFAAGHATDMRVLDAACGTGYGSALLAKTATHVDGVDISLEAIEWANRNYGEPNIAFHNACVEFTPFAADSFDIVLSFETLEHTLSPATALWEFVRVMKPSGHGIFSVPNQWGLTDNHFVDFNQYMLEKMLGERFESFKLFYNNSGTRKSRIAGIGPLEDLQEGSAECIIALCSQPMKSKLPGNLQDFWTSEIYQNAFNRHREFLNLRRSIPKFLRRYLLKD
jgi:SAM-dependent methyltransferase